MSSLSKNKVKEILEAVALEVVGDDSIPKLANHLDMHKQSLYDWVNKRKIVIESVKSKIPDINPKYLRTGNGPMFTHGHVESEGIEFVDQINQADQTLDELESDIGGNIERMPPLETPAQMLEFAESLIRTARAALRKK